jgi:CubicO group peptidase (beta-lactamase class C family)
MAAVDERIGNFEDFTDAIRAFLRQRVEVEKRNVGLVVGIMDDHGCSLVSCGKMNDGDAQEVNGDTLFEIGSITKTFTALLLQDMVERGEMKLEDPVAKFLPASVRMPTRHGREITLLHLATHSSGLPRMPDNFDPKRADNIAADYTDEQMYAFLSGCKLTRDPGAKFEYSNLGSGLLGQVIALKAGTDYESLVVDRICGPLQMDSTRIRLTPELKARFATGHNQLGYAVSGLDFQVLMGAGALRSSANDMLKYVSANLGLTPSPLTTLMNKTHGVRFRSVLRRVGVGLAWLVQMDPQGRQIIWHGGGTDGFGTFAGFDKRRRRGVVALSNSLDFDVAVIGKLLLESEWLSERRPKKTRINREDCESYAGQYQLAPSFSLGMLLVRALFFNVHKRIIFIVAGIWLAAILLLLWRTANPRIVMSAIFLSGVLAGLVALVLTRLVCAMARPVIGIRHAGERMFVQMMRSSHKPATLLLPIHDPAIHKVRFLLPQLTAELLPESGTRFFERMSGVPLTFCRDAQGKATRLTAHVFGGKCAFAKISDQAPNAPEPPKLRVAVKLDPKVYDAYVGCYEFMPSTDFPTGIKLTIGREGDQLVGRAVGKNVLQGTFDIYAESEADFFLPIVGAQLTFKRNGQAQVTAVILARAGWPDLQGNKLPNECPSVSGVGQKSWRSG